MSDDGALERALRSQIELCRESWTNLLSTRVLPTYTERKPTALDVGCGPGFVMDMFSQTMEVTGLDRSMNMSRYAGEHGHCVVRGRGEDLPFPDRSFDVVYCSFVLMWVPDPSRFISEMLRVSRRWVLCLAESDTSSRIDHPSELKALTECVKESVSAVGGNLEMGRSFHPIFHELGYEAEVGVNSGGVHRKEVGAQWMRDEWQWVEEVLSGRPHDPPLGSVRRSLEDSITSGKLFHFTPLFYALVDKERDRRS